MKARTLFLLFCSPEILRVWFKSSRKVKENGYSLIHCHSRLINEDNESRWGKDTYEEQVNEVNETLNYYFIRTRDQDDFIVSQNEKEKKKHLVLVGGPRIPERGPKVRTEYHLPRVFDHLK